MDFVQEMTTLVADIGGTNSRFAAAKVDADGLVGLSGHFSMPTTRDGETSFTAFWRHFRDSAPRELAESRYDAVALAVAGAVHGDTATLTNIPWNIEAGETRALAQSPDRSPGQALDRGPVHSPDRGPGQAFLINDFTAQGWACTDTDTVERTRLVRKGEPPQNAGIALVGPGTGLGHCALQPSIAGDGWVVIGSEAGHCSFSFIGRQERDIEDSMKRITGKAWLSNDDVVSGAGLSRLHQALTGNRLAPAEAISAGHEPTLELFARFLARACRNYCLALLPIGTLIVSGGVAGRNPGLVQSAAFFDEFHDAGDYRPIMESITVRLNDDPSLGLIGAAAVASARLAASAGFRP
jgi:glucokinase